MLKSQRLKKARSSVWVTTTDRAETEVEHASDITIARGVMFMGRSPGR
jgi:hypothetical protein